MLLLLINAIKCLTMNTKLCEHTGIEDFWQLFKVTKVDTAPLLFVLQLVNALDVQGFFLLDFVYSLEHNLPGNLNSGTLHTPMHSSYTHTYTHPQHTHNTHTFTHTHTHTQAHTQTHTHIHTNTHIHMQTHTYTQAHTQTQIHTNTHTHTLSLSLSLLRTHKHTLTCACFRSSTFCLM